MDTLTIQLTNKKAYKLLQELESLNLIRVLKKDVPSTQKLSTKFAGKLPTDIVEDLQKHIVKSRNEWNS